MKIIVLTAMRCEAQPIINHYRLKKNFTYSKFEVFSGLIDLIISGVGKLKSAIATAHIITAHAKEKDLYLLNLGIAGSADRNRIIGDLYLINKIHDDSTARNYYPDILLQHKLPETCVTSYDRAIGPGDINDDYPGLVDMEAAGFIAAAHSFLQPHQTICLKVLSDHLDFENLNKEVISELIVANISAVETLINQLSALDPVESFTVIEESWFIDEIVKRLRLTFAQQQILRQELIRFQLRTGQMPDRKFLLSFPSVKTKQTAKQQFKLLLQQLRSD